MKTLLAALAACLIALVHAAPAAAQEKSAVRPGFVLKPGSANILLLRPKISVGAQSTAGAFEPNADWTDQARENLGRALDAAQTKLGNRVVAAGDPVGPAARTLAEYQALFETVAGTVIEYQFFPGNRLPTKKRAGTFDWTLGPGVAALAAESGCEFALFVITEDQYGSTGRKVLQIFAALARVPISSGVHKGYAGLIDLRTGDLVWLNVDQQMGGDVRDAEGAAKRIGQLLEDFPGRPPAVAAPEPKR